MGGIVQDGLIYHEVTLAHLWHLLQEVDRVELKVIFCLFLGATVVPCTASALLNEKLLVEGDNIDIDEVLDVLGPLQLLIVHRVAHLVLAEEGLVACMRAPILVVLVHYSAHLATRDVRVLLSKHI